MFVSSVKLNNFRSYEKAEFGLEKVNVVVGENGSGKSNLVEAIYLLATGKSMRADRDTEMVRHGEPLAIAQCTMHNAQFGDVELKISVTEKGKKFEVNGVPRLWRDFVGNLRAVQFQPADMELVSGSPGIRRRYLDFVVAQMDREYRRSLVSYEKGLRQRNRLLQLIREGTANRSQLYFWDRLVVKNGEYLTTKRAEFLASTGFEYDKSIISESRLKQYEMEEVAAGSTLVGPHRDDFILTMQTSSLKSQIPMNIQDPMIQATKRDVSKYGSRGEQRMAVWWLKQCEIKYLGGQPLLLLDDIFSELDHKHREEVMALVKDYAGQVIMTSADQHLIPELHDEHVIRIYS